MLTVYNFPAHYNFEDVKVLFKNVCGVTKLLLDDLEADTIIGNRVISQKVTVALADEQDKELLINGINGFYLDGQQLFVQDVKKHKTKHSSHGSRSTQGPKSIFDTFNCDRNHEQYNKSSWTRSNRPDYNQTPTNNDDKQRSYKEDQLKNQGNVSKSQDPSAIWEYLPAFCKSKGEDMKCLFYNSEVHRQVVYTSHRILERSSRLQAACSTANSPQNSGSGWYSQHADNVQLYSSNMKSRSKQFQRERSLDSGGYQAHEESRRDRSRSRSRRERCRSSEHSQIRRSPDPHSNTRSKHRGSPEPQEPFQRRRRFSRESHREPQWNRDIMERLESSYAPDPYRHSSGAIDSSLVWQSKQKASDMDIQSDYINTLSSRRGMESLETHHIKSYNESGDVNITSSRRDKMESPKEHNNFNIYEQSSDHIPRWGIKESSDVHHMSDIRKEYDSEIDESRRDRSEHANDRYFQSSQQEVSSQALYDPEEVLDNYCKLSPQRDTGIVYSEQQFAKFDRKIISCFDKFPSISFDNMKPYKPVRPQVNLYANVYGKHVTEFDTFSSSSAIGTFHDKNSKADQPREDHRSSHKRESTGYDEPPAKKLVDLDIYNQSIFGLYSYISDPKKDKTFNQTKTEAIEKDWYFKSGSQISPDKNLQGNNPEKDFRSTNDDTQNVFVPKVYISNSNNEQKVISIEKKVENVKECASTYITDRLIKKFRLTDFPNQTQEYLKGKLSSAIAKRVDKICGSKKQTEKFRIIAKYDLMYDLEAEAEIVNRIYNGDHIDDIVEGIPSRKTHKFKLIHTFNDIEREAFHEEIDAFVDLMNQEFEDPDDETEDAIAETAMERGCVEFFKNIIKENVKARLMGIDAKLTVKLQFSKGDLPKMSTIEDFLKDYGSVYLKKGKGTSYLTEIKKFDDYDKLLCLGSAKIGGLTATFHSYYDCSLIKLSLPTKVKHRKDFFVSRILKQDANPRPSLVIKPKPLPQTTTIIGNDRTQTVDSSTDSDSDIVEVIDGGDLIDLTSDQEFEEEFSKNRVRKDTEVCKNYEKSNSDEDNVISQRQNDEKGDVDISGYQNIEKANDSEKTQHQNIEMCNVMITERRNTEGSNGGDVVECQDKCRNNYDEVTKNQTNEINANIEVSICDNTEKENVGTIRNQNTEKNDDVEVIECQNTEEIHNVEMSECDNTEKENIGTIESRNTDKNDDVQVIERQNTEESYNVKMFECDNTEKENTGTNESRNTQKNDNVQVIECQNTEKSYNVEITKFDTTERENTGTIETRNTEKNDDVEVTKNMEEEKIGATEDQNSEKNYYVEVTEYQNIETNNDGKDPEDQNVELINECQKIQNKEAGTLDNEINNTAVVLRSENLTDEISPDVISREEYISGNQEYDQNKGGERKLD